MLNPVPAYEPARFGSAAKSANRTTEGHVFFEDDFRGTGLNDAWNTVETAGASVTLPTQIPGGGGLARMALTAVGQLQDAVIYFGDMLQLDPSEQLLLECRASFSVAPTSGSHALIGMGSNHFAAGNKGSMTHNMWFRLSGDLALLIETDDNVTNNDQVATTETLVLDQFYTFQIDLEHREDVRFLLDGKRLLPQTTFDMSGLSSSTLLQPYIAIYKTSGTNAGTLDVDYFKAWQGRGA